jgi:outer membrane protein transport protein (OMPP1/FadL/TodX)
MRAATFALAALLLVAVIAPAGAGGFGIPDIGVRRTAMGAVIGRPDEGAAIYHDPAGLVLQHGWHLYLSLGLAIVRSELQLHAWDQSDRLLGVTAGADGYYQPVRPTRAMGGIPMLALSGELVPGKLVIGAAAYVGNAQGAGFDANDVTRYHMIDGYVVAPQAVVAASYQLLPSLALGGSVGVLNVRIHGQRDVYPIVNGTDISTIVGTRPELVLDGSGWAPSWMVAAFGRPHPRVTWGATVTGRVDATMQGPITITYSDDATSPGDSLAGTQTTTQLLPWAFMAGANVDLTPQLEVGAEARYWLYRQYKKQHTDITGIFLVHELETMKNYNDSWQVSGGVRVHDLAAAPGLELMLGSHFDRTPAPTATVTLDQPTFRHIGLHSGARYSVGRYRFGASYLRYFYLIPTVTDSMTTPPSNVRGSGANHIFTVSVEAAI